MDCERFGESVIYNGRWEDVPLEGHPKADLVLTDPPYGTTDLEWDAPVDWEAFFQGMGAMCKENPSFLLFCQMRTLMQIWHVREKWFRYSLVWEKPKPLGFFDVHKIPLRCYELVAAFREHGRPDYFAQKVMTDKGPYDKRRNRCIMHKGHYRSRIKRNVSHCEDGSRYMTDVLHFSNAEMDAHRIHPTQKPLDLMRLIVRAYSAPGQTILEPFAGSGTTCLAALMEGRRFVAVEQDAGYYAAAVKRLRDYERSPKPLRLDGEADPIMQKAAGVDWGARSLPAQASLVSP